MITHEMLVSITLKTGQLVGVPVKQQIFLDSLVHQPGKAQAKPLLLRQVKITSGSFSF